MKCRSLACGAKITATGLFLLVTLSCLVTKVSASWVSIYDVDDNPTDCFMWGETLRIKAYSRYTPYEVVVNDPNNVTVWSDTSYAEFYMKDVTGITTKLGWWSIRVGTPETHFAVAWYWLGGEVSLNHSSRLMAYSRASFKLDRELTSSSG